jgi:hypothetical protein
LPVRVRTYRPTDRPTDRPDRHSQSAVAHSPFAVCRSPFAVDPVHLTSDHRIQPLNRFGTFIGRYSHCHYVDYFRSARNSVIASTRDQWLVESRSNVRTGKTSVSFRALTDNRGAVGGEHEWDARCLSRIAPRPSHEPSRGRRKRESGDRDATAGAEERTDVECLVTGLSHLGLYRAIPTRMEVSYMTPRNHLRRSLEGQITC